MRGFAHLSRHKTVPPTVSIQRNGNLSGYRLVATDFPGKSVHTALVRLTFGGSEVANRGVQKNASRALSPFRHDTSTSSSKRTKADVRASLSACSSQRLACLVLALGRIASKNPT